MGKRVFPTENNVGTADGLESQIWREIFSNGSYLGYAGLLDARGKSRLSAYVYSGLTLTPGAGQPNLSVDIAAGVAIVNGLMIQTTTTLNVGSLAPNTTNYIYIGYSTDGTTKLATGVVTVSNTSGTVPANHVMIGYAGTTGTGVPGPLTSTVPVPGINAGTYTGDAQPNRLIFLGWQPAFVIVAKSTATLSSDPYALSGLGLGASFPGVKISGGAASLWTNNALRPEIASLGFLVSGNNVGDLNKSSEVFNYLAFA